MPHAGFCPSQRSLRLRQITHAMRFARAEGSCESCDGTVSASGEEEDSTKSMSGRRESAPLPMTWVGDIVRVCDARFGVVDSTPPGL